YRRRAWQTRAKPGGRVARTGTVAYTGGVGVGGRGARGHPDAGLAGADHAAAAVAAGRLHLQAVLAGHPPADPRAGWRAARAAAGRRPRRPPPPRLPRLLPLRGHGRSAGRPRPRRRPLLTNPRRRTPGRQPRSDSGSSTGALTLPGGSTPT